MHTFFDPVISLMRRLKYPQKMGLVAFVFAVPLALTLYLLLETLGGDIRVARMQRSGIEYESALLQLFRLVPEHRGLSNAALNGDASLGEKIAAKRNDIRASIAAMDAIDAKLGAELATTQHWQAIKQQWSTLENQLGHLDAPQSFAAHTGLIADILGFIAEVADTSKLVLDPALDSYYLIDAGFLKAPALMEDTAQARGLGAGAAARGQLTAQEKNRLLALSAKIQLADDAIERALRVAFASNPQLAPRLEEPRRAQRAATRSFLDLVQSSLIDAQDIQIQPRDYFAAGTRAIDAQIGLYQADVAVLDEIIGSRAQRLSERMLMIEATAAAALLAVIYLFAGFYLSVMQGLEALAKTARQIARGDLREPAAITSQDEMALVATAFNDMTQEFSRLIGSVSKASTEVAHSATELSVVTEQTTQSVLKQQVGTDQVAAAIVQMAASVQDVARNASRAAESAQVADEKAESGKDVVEQAIVIIEKLAGEVEHAATVITALGDGAKHIWSILDVIKDVTEQINLLALNAAIEAARAGAYGRGFAVVADEVRKLASRSQHSTQEIQKMIEQLQRNTLDAVRVMESGRAQARLGVEQAEKASVALQSITQAVAGINQVNAEIAAAAEQQSAVAEQVSHSVHAISQAAEETADGARQNTTRSEHMARLSAQLQGLVKQFRVIEEH